MISQSVCLLCFFCATLRKQHILVVEFQVQQSRLNVLQTAFQELRRREKTSDGEVLVTWFHEACARWRSHALRRYRKMCVKCSAWAMNSFAATLREQAQQRRHLDKIRSAIWFHAACQIHSTWCKHAIVVGETKLKLLRKSSLGMTGNFEKPVNDNVISWSWCLTKPCYSVQAWINWWWTFFTSV